MQTSAAISYHCSSAAKKEIKMLGFWTREAIPPVKDARSVGGALRCFRKGEFVYCTIDNINLRFILSMIVRSVVSNQHVTQRIHTQ